MSGNGKQVQLAPSQTPRYTCVTRPLTPQRTDTFPIGTGGVATPYGTSGSGGGAGGAHPSAGTMRGLPQPPTPPQPDLKQQLYGQGNVRGGQQYGAFRGGPPQQGVTPRPGAHQTRAQSGGGGTAWPPHPSQVMYGSQMMGPVYALPTGHIHAMPGAPYAQQQAPRQPYYTQPNTMPALMPQHQSYYNYANPSAQQQYLYSTGGGQASTMGRPQQAALPPQQPMAQPSQPQPPHQHQYTQMPARYPSPMQHPPVPPIIEKKKRAHAIPIVDPKSGKEVPTDADDNEASENADSGDRQPPQPDENSIAAVEEFTRLVTDAANKKDVTVECVEEAEDKMDLEIDCHVSQIPDNSISQLSYEESTMDIKNESDVMDEKQVKRNQISEISETPVVSAISNSPEIVPKQCHIVKQKQIEILSVDLKNKNNSALFKPSRQNKVSNIADTISADELNNVKNESKEFQAQKILTSALQPNKVAEDDRDKIETVDNVEIILNTQNNNQNSSDLSNNEPDLDIKIEAKENLQNEVKLPSPEESVCETSSFVPVQVLPSSISTAQKSKQDSKKNKSRSNANDKSDRNNKKNIKNDSELSIEVKVNSSSLDLTNNIVSQETEEKLDIEIPLAIDNNENVTSDINNEDVKETEEKLESLHLTSISQIETDVTDNVSVSISEISNVSEENKQENIEVVNEVKTIETPTEEAVVQNNEEVSGDSLGAAPENVEQTDENLDKNKSDKNEIPVLKYNYKDDQWSPLNTAGKKYYDTDFLMMLRNDPKSKKKPDNLNQLEIVSDLSVRQIRNNTDVSRSLPMLRQNDLLPGFAKSAVHSTVTPNRKSQHGKPPNKGISTPGSGLGNRPNIIHVNLSLRSDVKLNETENAWKPSRMRAVTMEEEELATQELFKTFRSVLNKLTPQKFDTLIAQVRSLKINTEERLSGVINLVFEKAIDEPNFSVAYALMCKELEQIQVKIPSADQKEERSVSFRGLILGRCQAEFDKDDDTTKRLQKEIDECADLEKKKELLVNLEEEERKIRRRSVGNVRFIGEMYKQNLLGNHVILYCIKQLLDKIEEETLECLCKLLTTIGKELEKKSKVELNQCFQIMQNIVDSKEKKVSSRVRFMLQDVIDLRKNVWVPRQQVANPKMMDQIKLEVEMEQKNSVYSGFASQSNMPRKDDRPSNMNKRGGSKSVSDEGWSAAPARNTRTKQQQTTFSVDSGKLSKMITALPITETSLGSPSQFQWSIENSANKKTVNFPTSHKSNNNLSYNRKPTETSNMYLPLDNQNSDNSSANNADKYNKKSYKSKGASIERSTFKSDEDQSSKSSEESTANKMKDILVENNSTYGIMNKILENFKSVDMPVVVKELILWGLESEKKETMVTVGNVTGKLIDDSVLDSVDFLTILKDTMDSCSSYFLKEGKLIWTMLAAFLWAHMKKSNLKLRDIHTAFYKVVTLEKGFELLTGIFLEKLKDSRGEIQALWEKSNMKLLEWMDEDKADQFSEEFPLKWLQSPRSITQEEACSEMLQMMYATKSRDTIKEWIEKNIGGGVQEAWFIRAITEAVHTYGLCSEFTSKPRFDSTETLNRLEAYYPLLCNYVAGQENQELECLFAIQHLMHKLEHPQGITVQLFEYLWEYGDMVSLDGFVTWEKNTDPKEQEGKGVMLKSLTSFFTAIQTMEDSDDATSVIEEEY